MTWAFSPMDEQSAIEIVDWRYAPPYDIYDLGRGNVYEVVRDLTLAEHAYYALRAESGALIVFCCFGAEAQVPGGDYGEEALDIGMGVRPNLTGRGEGHLYAQAVLDYAQRTYAPPVFRVTIAEFNERAQRVWSKLGFEIVQRFRRRPDGFPFVVMTRAPAWGANDERADPCGG